MSKKPWYDIIKSIRKRSEFMNYLLKNKDLEVTVKTLGAELMSVKNLADNTEYIWQGDAKYWEDRSPVCFPVTSSFFEGKYTYEGKTYEMGLHGFAQYTEFEVISARDTELVLKIESTDKTRKQYPFDFELTLTYTLDGRELVCRADIKNTSNKVMPVTFGAHPGFNTPFTVGAGEFEDYYLEFSEACMPLQEPIDKVTYFLTGEKIPLVLENGKILRLRHDMFIPDGIFCEQTAKAVTLKSDKDNRSITVKFDDMDYFGIWQEYGKDTPFLCIEPWCAPPDNHGVPQDLTERTALFMLDPNETKTVSYSIIFN